MTSDWKFAYQIGPIDWWAGSLTVDEFLKSCRAEERALAQGLGTEFFDEGSDVFIKKVATGLAFLKDQCKSLKDFNDLNMIRIAVLPNPDEAVMFVFLLCKQGNNGTTFVASPVRLPWMEEL